MAVSLFIGLTFYAWNTKTDFTLYGSFLSSIGSVLVLFISISVFIGATFKLIYCVIGLALFSAHLVFDTQLIIGKEDAYAQIENDDYIMAAISLYIDILKIFVYVFQLFQYIISGDFSAPLPIPGRRQKAKEKARK
jgi:FtsH-binding integral membrane protein